MPNSKLITVFGATGRQGGSVARAMLTRRDWHVRVVTRRPACAQAQALSTAGAELCVANLDDPRTLAAAVRGASAIFAVTNYWEHRDAVRELQQATHLAQAAALTSAHVLWSTLEDTRGVLPPAPGQRFSVAHMDAKAEADAVFAASGVPTTRLLTSFFWESLIDFGLGPRRAPDGVLELALPLGDLRLPGIAASDIGRCVATLLAESDRGSALPAVVGLAREHLSGADMARTLSGILGEPVRWIDVPVEQYAALPFPGADELAAMFAFKQRAEASFRAARSVDTTRRLHPGALDFETWARGREHALRAAL